jgi:hypothetical protein
MKQRSKRTIENNLNSLKVYSKYYQSKGVVALSLNLLTNATNDAIEIRKLAKRSFKMLEISTLNGYLTNLSSMVRSVWGIAEFRRVLKEKEVGKDSKPVIS